MPRRALVKWLSSLSKRLRRDGRVAEGARLESVYTGNRIEGSNPSLSAITLVSWKIPETRSIECCLETDLRLGARGGVLLFLQCFFRATHQLRGRLVLPSLDPRHGEVNGNVFSPLPNFAIAQPLQ